MCEHDFDDDGVCVLCGYDAVEAWHYNPDRQQRQAEYQEYLEDQK